MDEYESLVLSYDFSIIAAFTGEGATIDLGFMWKADLENNDIRERVIARNNWILEKERRSWFDMDEFLEKRRAEWAEKKANSNEVEKRKLPR